MKPFFTALFFFSLVISGCKKPAEPVLKGIYHLNNQSPYTLYIEAKKNGNPIGLITDSVMSLTMGHFCTVFEGSGGHVMPSNFFTEFRVIAHLAAGDSVLYQGVTDAHWARSFPTESDHEFALTVN